jgi:hypothetical protein
MNTAIMTKADQRSENKRLVAKISEIHQDRIDSAKYAYDMGWICVEEWVLRMRNADKDFINGIDRIYGGI